MGRSDSFCRREGGAPTSPRVMSLPIPTPGRPHAKHVGSTYKILKVLSSDDFCAWAPPPPSLLQSKDELACRWWVR